MLVNKFFDIDVIIVIPKRIDSCDSETEPCEVDEKLRRSDSP